jgi:permuted papain-like amidase YaeF/Yiix C92 family enzyme
VACMPIHSGNRRSFFLAACLFAAFGSADSAAPALQDGDIVFQTSRSSQSEAVQRATGSPYSHMGMVVHRNGRPYVVEAVATVQYTPLDQWIARGAGHHFVAKRLRNAGTLLTPAALSKLRSAADRFVGRSYDLAFGWADDRIYCSELVWKAYDRALGVQIGHLQKIRDFHLSDPAVQAKMRERYGNRIPLDKPVISPVAMFDAPELVTVAVR